MTSILAPLSSRGELTDEYVLNDAFLFIKSVSVFGNLTKYYHSDRNQFSIFACFLAVAITLSINKYYVQIFCRLF